MFCCDKAQNKMVNKQDICNSISFALEKSQFFFVFPGFVTFCRFQWMFQFFLTYNLHDNAWFLFSSLKTFCGENQNFGALAQLHACMTVQTVSMHFFNFNFLEFLQNTWVSICVSRTTQLVKLFHFSIYYYNIKHFSITWWPLVS